MSGILKSVGKVFKKVVTSKVFKIAALAAAVYFTAGIGLAAAGSEFAAALPGIQGVGGALGILGDGAGVAAGAGEAAAGGGFMNTAATTAAKTGGSSFLQNIMNRGGDAQPEQLSGPGYMPTGNGNSGGTGPGNSGGFLGLNDNGQKILFESLAGGAKAVAGGLAAKSNAEAYVQNQKDERDWHDKNRKTVDLSAVYAPKYKTPGIIQSIKDGG